MILIYILYKTLNNINKLCTMEFKDEGDFIFILGSDKTYDYGNCLSGSEYMKFFFDEISGKPKINIEKEVFYSDLYSITSHKWACGPEGLGATYVSDRFIHETDPTIIGWKSLKKEQGIYEPSDNLFHHDARKCIQRSAVGINAPLAALLRRPRRRRRSRPLFLDIFSDP